MKTWFSVLVLQPSALRNCHDAQPIIPPDLREKPRSPVNSNVITIGMKMDIPIKLGIKETDFRVVFGGTRIDYDPDKEEYNRKEHKYSLQSAVDLLERWLLPIPSTPFITSDPVKKMGKLGMNI